MLKIVIPASEQYDSVNNLFYNTKEQALTLEHSLVSVAKWESKWRKPFLDKKHDKTIDEMLDYIKCMTLTQNVNPLVYNNLTSKNIDEVNRYIDEPMTATTFSESNSATSREIVTAEIIYYWMTVFNIPFECQKWHLNRLLTLIRVCSIKNAPKKKMSERELRNRNRSLNKSRRNAMNSRG